MRYGGRPSGPHGPRGVPGSDEDRAYAKSFYNTTTQRQRHVDANLKRRYSISLQEYEELFQKQGGVCAICGSPERSGRRLAVDHDHVTMRIRGLLCTGCNRKLGWYELFVVQIEQHLRK